LDLHTAFEARSLSEGDRAIPVERVAVGDLALSAGTIAAFDPLSAAHAEPFTRRVPIGKYGVELLKTKQTSRFALARVMFAVGAPATWELAVKAGQDPYTLRSGQIYGYAVDSGVGCFADGSALADLSDQAVSDAILRAGQ